MQLTTNEPHYFCVPQISSLITFAPYAIARLSILRNSGTMLNGHPSTADTCENSECLDPIIVIYILAPSTADTLHFYTLGMDTSHTTLYPGRSCLSLCGNFNTKSIFDLMEMYNHCTIIPIIKESILYSESKRF